uniref:PqqD family peptide modification chaperone n=1 Tax=uncultured Erythrobacter sp. TaxID=263913 RepID=UPI002638FFEA|nr:PqqD family peptide modification chaperone [uncultured Erythrobacter sp.]
MSKPAPIGLNDIVAKSENFVESNVDGEAILMHLDEGNFSSLKSTGLRIWAELEEPKTVAVICQNLMAEFEVEEADCQEQTIAFLSNLRERGLIETRDS